MVFSKVPVQEARAPKLDPHIKTESYVWLLTPVWVRRQIKQIPGSLDSSLTQSLSDRPMRDPDPKEVDSAQKISEVDL